VRRIVGFPSLLLYFGPEFMNYLQKLFLIALVCCAHLSGAWAQNPITWTFSGSELEPGLFQVILTGTIEPGWATYSQELESDMGPVPTSIQFMPGSHFSLVGKPEERGDRSTHFDKVFDMNLTKFKNKAVFIQKMKVMDISQPIKGSVIYMACNEEMCLPPKEVLFSIHLKSDNK
jgi:thiol:disulfide interchange protein DsbD